MLQKIFSAIFGPFSLISYFFEDTMAAKPLVLYESDDLVAMGSEEIAIRSVLPQEIDTYDPFDGEVKVWQI